MAALLAGMMLVGCGQKQTEEPAEEPAATEETQQVEEKPADTGAMLGGWTVNTETNNMMADDDVARFETAMEGLLGVNYTPVQVIATQVVNGTNYAYLASGSTVTAEPKNGWYVIVVNENTSGEVSLINIREIDLADIHTKENADGAALGGWTATDTGKAGMLPGQDAQAAFDEAQKKLLGVTLNPVVLLGTQVVNGTNYAILSRGKTSTENPEVQLYVTTFNANSDGSVEVLENNLLDLEYYVSVAEPAPIEGDWELTKVVATVPGGEPAEMSREENQSLYGDEGYYTFYGTGTGKLSIVEGDSTAEIAGGWVENADGTYTFEMDNGEELNVTYDAASDTLVRVFHDDAADAQYSDIEFIYTRK